MPWVTSANAALLTDMYELTMAASYHRHGMNEPATFDLFVRHLPPRRNFLIACGLEDALAYLETLRFHGEAIDYLRSLDMFDGTFLDYLRDEFRFSGEVWAAPEGAAVFPNEPLLRVTAPLIEAQVVETFLLNCVNFQTLIASKAARIALACGERTFVDFSPRRDHGADAALKVGRAAFVGGAVATSNVVAAQVYGMPPSGTMAHSYVMSFDEEIEAFRAFAEDFGEHAVLLIDTYDTVEGARRAAIVANELQARGTVIRGVRLDSGDLAELAIAVRRVLDEAGCGELQIFASGDLDEDRIADLLAAGAPIDAFGVGTQLGTSADAPALGGVYKLVADTRGPKVKLSSGKATLPGVKHVYRVTRGGRYDHDVIALADEPPPDGEALLAQVMAGGKRLAPPEPLAALQARCRATLDALPERLRTLDEAADPYEVRLEPRLDALVREMRAARY